MKKRIRHSAIAGTWYPGSRHELTELIDGLVGSVDEIVSEDRPFGLIVPHAGYSYSGLTAAHAYTLLKGHSTTKVVILAPMHRWARGLYFTPECTHYETPLGEIPVDTAAVRSLSERLPVNYLDYDEEHSLEIQLPFLQRILSDFELLPLMIGGSDLFQIENLVEGLANVKGYENALWIASSDLHHESDYDTVVRQDAKIIEALDSGNIDRIQTALMDDACTACGRLPVIALMKLAERKGHRQVQILHHTNSGDVSGDKAPGQYTVGYVSASII